jgi:hypothetical protein
MTEAQGCGKLYYGMVKLLPIMLGEESASLLGQAGWCAQHNWQGQGHSMTLRSGVNKSCVQQTHFGHCYACLIIIRRLCHITWSRKWPNLPPLQNGFQWKHGLIIFLSTFLSDDISGWIMATCHCFSWWTDGLQIVSDTHNVTIHNDVVLDVGFAAIDWTACHLKVKSAGMESSLQS